MNMEVRMQDTEIRASEDGSLTVSGYVNKTEQLSNVLGITKRFVEKIAKGAFQRAIQNAKRDIDFLAEHNNKLILASTRNGSLELREDEQGLFMSATIAPTSWGKDTYTLIKSGIYRNMSFGFRTIKDSWRSLENGLYERTIEELELFEVSVVKDPAYSQSTISARGIELIEDVKIPAELEEEQRSMKEKLTKILEKLETLDTFEERFNSLESEIKELRATQEKALELREEEQNPEHQDYEKLDDKSDKKLDEKDEEKEEKEEKPSNEHQDKEESDEKSKDSDNKKEDKADEDKEEDEEFDEEQERSKDEAPNFSEFRNRLASLK